MQLNSPISSENLMQSRLGALCLQSIDVGGAGDCFFRSVSHQLYDNSNHHMHIRTAGVQFMRDNPERFIESNTENSWLRYLNNMCIQGTWADALIIQAVQAFKGRGARGKLCNPVSHWAPVSST